MEFCVHSAIGMRQYIQCLRMYTHTYNMYVCTYVHRVCLEHCLCTITGSHVTLVENINILWKDSIYVHYIMH